MEGSIRDGVASGPLTLSGVTNQGALNISGNAQLPATGPVKIYVTGNINIAGNGVTTANNTPPNLLIYGTVDPNNAANKTTSVSVGGNAAFYGAIYAPAADITVDGTAGAAVYGALTGKTATLNSGAVHRDEALENLGATTSVVVTTTNTTSYTLSTKESIEPAQSAPMECHCFPGTATTLTVTL